jgi:CheY-like chemotaxis protein
LAKSRQAQIQLKFRSNPREAWEFWRNEFDATCSHRKFFALFPSSIHFGGVTQPLALVLYEKLMPGSQLVNRLHDLNYRVQMLADANELAARAQSDGPMLIIADLASRSADICALIAEVRKDSVTAHIPILAFADATAEPLQTAARQAGATLVVSSSALVAHLPQLLEQVLRVE